MHTTASGRKHKPRPTPLPLHSHSPASGPHSPPAHTAPGPATRASPPQPKKVHRPATNGPNMRDSLPPTPSTPHTPATKRLTPHDTPTPPSDPYPPTTHSPESLGLSAPAPECSPRRLFPATDADAPTLAYCRSPAQPKPAGGDRSPTPPPHTAANQDGPLGHRIAIRPLQRPAANPQPGGMASILPAVAAAKTAAAREAAPAHMPAQPTSKETTTSASSSSC